MDIILSMFQISFQDYSPAVFIRNLTQSAIEPFASPLKTFDRDELRPLLMQLFKWKQFEFMDVVNILGFGRDKYVKITLDQLTDYILEKYLGETAIIRYIKHNGYARRDENIMNKKEFVETLALGLDFLNDFHINQFTKQFQAIFNELDIRRVGTIPHAEYCRFLKYYLGSESPMAVNPTKRVTQLSQSREMVLPSPLKQVRAEEQSPKRVVIRDNAQQDYNFSLNRQITSQQNLREYVNRQTALEQFHNLIVSSITSKCREYDLDEDQKLFKNECQQFLYDVLQLEPNSINFIIANYFNFGNGNTVTFTEMIQIVCEVHFRQILTNIIKNDRQIQLPSKILMNKQYFTDKIMENCYFFPIQPTFELLQRVFQQLLLKSENSFSKSINLDDFRAYILTHCCHNKFVFRHQTKKSTHTLANPPASIIQAQNSHYQQDQSQGSSIIQSRRQFASTHKSISKPKLDDSKEHSIQGGQIGLSSNKRTKTNKFSQQSIIIQNQILPASFPPSNKQMNVGVIKGSNQSIKMVKMANQSSHVISNNNIYLSKQREEKPFKEILWSQLEFLVSKYSSSQNGSINKQQCDQLFSSQEIFKEDKSIFLNKTSKFFEKRPQVQLQLIISYIIHLKGEQALIQFNSQQIKGKSTLNQTEISQILFNAYGVIMCLNKQTFQQFSKKLFAQNGKKLFQYKNYLQLVGRNLSLKNYF